MRVRNVLLVLLAAVLLAGCAVGASNTRQDVTPVERAKMQSLLMMERYKTQFADASSLGILAQDGKLTADQLDVYRVKRQLLVDVKPLIEAYDAIIAGGGVPSPSKEQEIFNILNRLGTLAK